MALSTQRLHSPPLSSRLLAFCGLTTNPSYLVRGYHTAICISSCPFTFSVFWICSYSFDLAVNSTTWPLWTHVVLCQAVDFVLRCLLGHWQTVAVTSVNSPCVCCRCSVCCHGEGPLCLSQLAAVSFYGGESPQSRRCLHPNTAQWAPSSPCQGNPQCRHRIGWVRHPSAHAPEQVGSAPWGAEGEGGTWWHQSKSAGLYPIESGNTSSFCLHKWIDAFVWQRDSLYVEAGDTKSISNKDINSQCPSINDLLTTLATSNWTSLSRLFSVSDQWTTDDDFSVVSVHCWFALEKKRERQWMRETTKEEEETEHKWSDWYRDADIRHVKHL